MMGASLENLAWPDSLVDRVRRVRTAIQASREPSGQLVYQVGSVKRTAQRARAAVTDVLGHQVSAV